MSKDLLKDIKTGFKQRYAMTAGLKPVFKVETCKSLKSGSIGDKIIEDTFPAWVKIAGSKGFDATGIIKTKVAEFLGSQSTDTPLLGVMIDHAFMNRYRTIANLIFQNVLKNKPTGNEYLSEDMIECGFPIRVTLGALTPEGNFIQHPYETSLLGSLSASKIYPTFTGMVAAQTQEIVSSGDRFQITCYGFEYLLSKAPLYEFKAKKGDHLREVFARLLHQFATMADHYGTKDHKNQPVEPDPDSRFGPTRPEAALKWPVPILRAMGLIDKRNRLLSVKKIWKNIRMVNSYARTTGRGPALLHDVDFPLHANRPKKGQAPKGPRKAMSYLDALNRLAPSPQAAIESQEELAKRDIIENYYSKFSFYFDYDGRPTIMGKLMSTAEIVAGKGKPTHDKNRARVHDAVIGGNIIHLQMTSTIGMSAGRIALHHMTPNPSVPEPSLTHATSDRQINLGGRITQETLGFYGPGSYWGNENLFYYDDPSRGYGYAGEVLQEVADRYKYFGMRGSSYMVANPKMMPGDAVRIVDIRDKEGFGTAISATIDIGKAAASKLDSAIAERFPSLSKKKRLAGKTVNLGLKGIEDVYWIWKSRHYVGQDMITSKVFFVKEPQSLIATTDAYRQHQIQRRKAQQAQGP